MRAAGVCPSYLDPHAEGRRAMGAFWAPCSCPAPSSCLLSRQIFLFLWDDASVPSMSYLSGLSPQGPAPVKGWAQIPQALLGTPSAGPDGTGPWPQMSGGHSPAPERRPLITLSYNPEGSLPSAERWLLPFIDGSLPLSAQGPGSAPGSSGHQTDKSPGGRRT